MFRILLTAQIGLGAPPNSFAPPPAHPPAPPRDQRRTLTERLRTLLKALRKAGLVEGKPLVIKARVPIIKCKLRLGVQVDVSLGAANGAAAVEYVQRQVVALPPLRPLVLVVKAVLKEAGLNEVFRGGLSSYCTTLMAIAHLVAEGVSPDPASSDCGRLLWSFFDRYGRRFNYQRQAVRIARGGVAPKPLDWVKPDRLLALAVEDPQDEGKDIGSGSFNIAAVRDCFARAAGALAAAAGQGSGGVSGWAAVQAEGASRSLCLPNLLSTVLNVDLAISRDAGASQARRTAAWGRAATAFCAPFRSFQVEIPPTTPRPPRPPILANPVQERARLSDGALPPPRPSPMPWRAERGAAPSAHGKPAGRYAGRRVQVAILEPRLRAMDARAGRAGRGAQCPSRGLLQNRVADAQEPTRTHGRQRRRAARDRRMNLLPITHECI